MSPRRRRLTALVLTGALLVCAAPAAAEEWVAWPLPVPPGSTFQTPSGVPGDLTFFAPNRGLMTVGGNNSVPEGLYSWDGVSWHQLATVCGSGASARIAWAGPDEFWTIARPSLPRPPLEGTALCHFKAGEVIGSYSADSAGDDPYQPLQAAACSGPSDCWFGGFAGIDGTGARSGGFHLHWDGTSVQSVYAPQGRAVSDLLVDGDRFFESTFLSGRPGGAPDDTFLREPETVPRLLHRIAGGAFANDPFLPLERPGVPPDRTELRALDSDGQTRWAVGGGAVADGVPSARPPVVARLDGDVWKELELTGDPLPTDRTLGDVAAIPGSGAAWVTVIDPNGGDGTGEQPTVAHIAADGAVRIVALAGSGEPLRGAAARIDCPAADDCWVATARGYLYRLASAPRTYPRDEDPAFQGTITQRPNESAEQAIPDDPPQDDSLLLAPPVEIPAEPTEEELAAAAEPCRLPKLITRVKSRTRGKQRLQLVISFRVARRARIGMTARRGGKVVARAALRTLPRGNRSLTLKITRKRYPTQLSFVIRNDSGTASCAASATGTAAR